MFELAAFRQANPGRPITLTPLFLSRSVSVLYVSWPFWLDVSNMQMSATIAF